VCRCFGMPTRFTAPSSAEACFFLGGPWARYGFMSSDPGWFGHPSTPRGQLSVLHPPDTARYRGSRLARNRARHAVAGAFGLSRVGWHERRKGAGRPRPRRTKAARASRRASAVNCLRHPPPIGPEKCAHFI
jgi:hypothetical protein